MLYIKLAKSRIILLGVKTKTKKSILVLYVILVPPPFFLTMEMSKQAFENIRNVKVDQREGF